MRCRRVVNLYAVIAAIIVLASWETSYVHQRMVLVVIVLMISRRLNRILGV